MRDHDDTGFSPIQYGRIASVDLVAGRVAVELGDLTTQPIRFFTGGSGDTLVWTRPKVGEQVMVIAPEGDIAGAVALRGLDCDAFPPVGDPDRELIRFQDGATLSYDPAAHALAVVLPAGATVSIVAPGGVTLDCDVRITGDVEIDGGLTIQGGIDAGGTIQTTKDVTAGSVSLKQHVHTAVQPGTGLSGAPKP